MRFCERAATHLDVAVVELEQLKVAVPVEEDLLDFRAVRTGRKLIPVEGDVGVDARARHRRLQVGHVVSRV
jgi:hypothetical protein